MNLWPKKPTMWTEGNGHLCVSVPFTWNLPEVRAFLSQKSAWWQTAQVGGPAVDLMPRYLDGLTGVKAMPGEKYHNALQRVNPMATRTTEGCIRSCQFCGIGQGMIEPGGMVELPNWTDLPIVCDNNLLAASVPHFDRVMDRLEKHVGVDFNQGLDARLLSEHHAQRFARLKSPKIRLACDSNRALLGWNLALDCLLENGVKRGWVSTYILVGFDSGPSEDMQRCEIIQEIMQNFSAMPMWFHELDCLEWNHVTQKQRELGWSHKERTRIMRRFYKAKYGGAA